MSSPSSRIWPAVGRSKPAISRSVVVLPQPDGPSSEKNSPPAMSQVDAVDRRDVAELLDEIDELDFAAVHGHTSSAAMLVMPMPLIARLPDRARPRVER